MPRVEHEPWCEDHCSDEFVGGNGSGVCRSFTANFGPLDGMDEWMSRGCLSAERVGDEDVQVFFDYLSSSGGGRMDVGALRSVREALVESPTEFLAALDRIIDSLGDAVPAREKSRDEVRID